MRLYKKLFFFLLACLFSTNGVQAKFIDPSNENIEYHGRWNYSNPSIPDCEWGATYIDVKFQGTGIAIEVSEGSGTIAYQYSIDGGTMVVIPSSHTNLIQLASGLSNTEHTLKFVRRSAGNWGRTYFHGLEITGGDILEPDPEQCLKFEFVGNSISVGFGNESTGGNSADVENGYLAWGPQLARLYEGDWRVEGHSGQGMYMNLYDNPNSPVYPTMADEWERMYSVKYNDQEYLTPWGFDDGFTPDFFFCSLGTNDFANTNSYPTREQFNGRYNQFLDLVRTKYPDATIILFGLCLKNWNQPNHAYDEGNKNLEALVAERNAAGDDNIYFVNPRPGHNDDNMWLPNASDYTDWTHPVVSGHTTIASKMKEFMDGETAIANKISGLNNACVTHLNSTEMISEEVLKVYPNPTHGVTSIELKLNQSEEILIEVLDMQGRKIKTIEKGAFEQGKYLFQWDSNENGITSGEYLVKVIADSKVTTQIISVVK